MRMVIKGGKPGGWRVGVTAGFLTWVVIGCGGSTSPVAAGAAAPQTAAMPDESDAGSPVEKGSAGSQETKNRHSASEVRPAVELRFPRSDTPWLGVELRATAPEEPGVMVARALPGSPAERAGLQSGDVLLTLDGQPVSEPRDVVERVQEAGHGHTMAVAVLRDGTQRLLRVALTGKPQFEDQLRLAFVARPAPEIQGVVTFQGEASSLRELRGDVVVLEFWASWCGVCRYLAPILDEMYKDYRPLGLEVVGITDDPPELGSEVARRTGMSYTLASDTEGKAQRAYLASQIPVVFVIDRRGVVRDVMVGFSRERLTEVQELVADLVRGTAQ